MCLRADFATHGLEQRQQSGIIYLITGNVFRVIFSMSRKRPRLYYEKAHFGGSYSLPTKGIYCL